MLIQFFGMNKFYFTITWSDEIKNHNTNVQVRNNWKVTTYIIPVSYQLIISRQLEWCDQKVINYFLFNMQMKCLCLYAIFTVSLSSIRISHIQVNIYFDDFIKTIAEFYFIHQHHKC